MISSSAVPSAPAPGNAHGGEAGGSPSRSPFAWNDRPAMPPVDAISTPRVARPGGVGQIAGGDRPAGDAAARGASRRKNALDTVRDDADLHPGAVERPLSAREVGVQDRVAFARCAARSADRVGWQPDEVDEWQCRHYLEPR